MSEEDTTAEILRSLQNIVTVFKTELQHVKANQLSPEDVSTIVESHSSQQTEEVKQLQTAVAHLKVKGQQRISMDTDFMAEVKRVVAESVPSQVSDGSNVSAVSKEELSKMIEKHVSKHNFRKASEQDEDKPIPGSVSTYPVGIRPKTKFTEQQQIRNKEYSDQCAQRRADIKARAQEINDTTKQYRTKLAHEEKIKNAKEKVEQLCSTHPRIKNPVLKANREVEIEQAKLDALELEYAQSPTKQKKRECESQLLQVQLATTRANCFHT